MLYVISIVNGDLPSLSQTAAYSGHAPVVEWRERGDASMPAAGAAKPVIAAILPCYKSRDHALAVIEAVPAIVSHIICVDDCCPAQTGRHIEEASRDPRVRVIFNARNLGVGGAVCAGYAEALRLGVDIAVKIDSDGQMDPAFIATVVAPLLVGKADYTKGNRFYNLADVKGMPTARLLGNAALSFLTKLSSGYWNIFDPTNGYTAIHARVLERLPLHKIAPRYFFESDVLFRLGTLRARVMDVPMTAVYGSEQSNLVISEVALSFLSSHARNLAKRIFYTYFLRDFTIASLYLILGIMALGLGAALGVSFWLEGMAVGSAATSGQVMLAAFPLLLGVQMVLAFLHYDFEHTPVDALHPMLPRLNSKNAA
jgi:glycosyltransferase involved in cell wall biosynthesis